MIDAHVNVIVHSHKLYRASHCSLYLVPVLWADTYQLETPSLQDDTYNHLICKGHPRERRLGIRLHSVNLPWPFMLSSYIILC